MQGVQVRSLVGELGSHMPRGAAKKKNKFHKTEKDKYHMMSLICGILKNDTNELTYKTEIDSTDIEK